MTIHHHVLIKLIDSATDVDRKAVADGLNGLPESIPEIESLICGEVVGRSVGEWDLGVSATFATIEDYETYSAHPVHRKFGADVVEPVKAKTLSVQFEVP